MASNPFDYAERFNPAKRREGKVRGAEPLPDPVGAEIDRMRDQEIRTTLASLPQPEQAARVTRLAREAEVNPLLVEDDPDTVDAALRARRVAELARTDPAFARFALRNPRGAAAAQDDTDSLGFLGSAWDVIKNAPGRLVAEGIPRIGQWMADTYNAADEWIEFGLSPIYAGASALSRATGIEALDPQDYLRAKAKNRALSSTSLKSVADRGAETFRGATPITEGLLQGVGTAPLTLTAVATRDARTAAAIMGTLIGGGSYQEARREGLDPITSLRYGVTQGSIESVTERIPAGTLVDLITRKLPFGKAFVRELGQEMTGEQIATALQDMTDWAYLPENRDKTLGEYLRERPEAAGNTALAVVGGTATTTGSIAAAQRATDVTVKVAERMGQAQRARREKKFFDDATKAAERSKLRTRDPEAFRALLKEQAEESGASSVFIPSEAVREYQQSDSYDQREDPFAKYGTEEADFAGGDLVVPIEDALTELVGTPAWEAVRDHVRLSPGGMSPREATTFEEAIDDVMAEISDSMAKDGRSERQARAVRDKIVDRVAEAFGVSFTSPVARDIAELFTARMETRASRLGQNLSEAGLDGFAVRQIMPDGVAVAVKADQLDLVINALRTRKPVKTGVGPSLLDFIKERGGINDTGGDLRSMGMPPGMLRDFDPAQGSFGGVSGEGDFGIDTTLRAAIESGFFPEMSQLENEAGPSQLDTQVLLDAIGRELAGEKVFAQTRTDPMRAAAEDLRAMLEDAGLSPDEMSDAEIREAVEGMASEGTEGRALEQRTAIADEVDAAWDGTRTFGNISLGEVPSVLKAFGFNGVLTLNRGKLHRIANKHDVPREVLYRLPELLASPWAAFPSSDQRRVDAVVVALRARDANGDPVIAIVDRAGGVSFVSSVYGKRGRGSATGEDWIARQVANAKREGKQVFETGGPPERSAEPISGISPARPRKPILSLREKGKFDQSDMANAPRGRILFDQNKRTIELFQSRNLSTPLHELSHMWLEELFFDASLPDAPEQLKQDAETVKAYFAQNGHAMGENGQIPTEAHELWARSGERYLMEGKAPSSALTRLFETFRQWLVNIYKTVDRLRAPITPEIREVFDRLIATDEEIAATRERQSLSALFKDIADSGMNDAEFAAYREQVENARADAHAKLLDKTMATIRRRETERYRDLRKGIKAEEQERIDASPLFRAIALMRAQRISKQWIIDEMGEDALALLPVRVPPLYADGGVDPNIVAEQTGYSGGRDMIEALIGVERAHRQAKEGGDQRSMRERAIESATDAEFQRRYGDPFSDGSIEREALAAVHSDMQGEVIASELRILSRKTGRRPTPYRIARDWARGKIRSGIVAEEASPGALQRYARNAAKAGREAEAAMLKGDAEETFRQKQFQMMNNALLAEAKQAADEVEAAVKRMDKTARARTRKSVDQDYLEQAQALLEAVDLRKRSQVGIDRQGQWEAWAAARETEGFDVVVPGSFEATIGKTNWSRLSVENLLALDEAVKQVLHLGRLKQTLLDNQEQREWDEIYREAEESADNIGRKPPKGSFTEPGWWDAIKSGAATMDAALLKMEQVFDWLDQGNLSGVFNRIVFRPIAEAQAREQDMTRDYFKRIHDALEAVPKETIRHWGDKITLDLIDPQTGLPAVVERKKIVAMALNWGNAGNRQRLADGYGWSEQGVERALMDTLSEPEWRFVQQTWDIIDTLWPEIEKMERAINGVAPEKVEATEIVTPFGTLRGGYYPGIYDTTLDYTSEEQAGRKADLFEAAYVRATTRASATKERMEKVGRPILLDVGVINRHLGEVIHDVTHREAVMRAHKFLTNRRVMKAVDETLGPEVRKQFRPWLQHVANSWAQDRAGNEGLGKFMSKARANTTVVGMGWRFTTMLTQLAGYSNSFEKVGARWVSAAIAQTSAHPLETFEFVMSRSGEMRGRMDTIDRDIRAEMKRMDGGLGAAANKLTAAKRFAFHGIGYMDRVVSISTWLGAYNKAISEGLTEEEAIYAGDKAIRLSQGAAGPKDLAAVATGQGRYGEAFKWLTMFYSYLSTVYSRQRNLGRDVRRAGAKDLPALMARAWWLIVVPPLLAELLSGRGPDEDEDPAWWAFQKMLSQSLGAIPGVRDIAEPALAGLTGGFSFGYRLSPVQAAGESVVKVSKDVGRIAEGDETTRATRNAMETVGYFTGLVPGQLAASTQFLIDVGAGDADPEGFADWYTGLTKGRLPEE